jgi:UrcA family protein
MNTRTIKNTVLASFVAVAALGAAVAGAGEQLVTQSVAVKYGDLDLATSQGNAALYRRLRTAAVAVCGETDARDLRASADARACYAKAMEDAVRQIDRAPLTALHARRAARSAG